MRNWLERLLKTSAVNRNLKPVENIVWIFPDLKPSAQFQSTDCNVTEIRLIKGTLYSGG